MSARDFGREVGLRDTHHLNALFVAGHLSAIRSKHPKTGILQLCLSTDDIAAFPRRFATISTLAKERAVHHSTVRTWIKAANLRPYSPNGEDFGLMFLRDEVDAALH